MPFDAIRMWFRAVFRRSGVETEMEKEMRFHIDMETEANIRRGMDPGEARRRAQISFGGRERHRESVRDERGTRWLEETLAELRHAIRTLGKNRGFTALATLTLAIGIGATAGVYSLANWVMLRPVPGIVAPEDLVVVSFEDGPGQPTGFSYEMLSRVSESVNAFTGVMGTQTASLQLAGEGVPARDLEGAIVAGDYFGVLGVRPARGRFFTRDELTASSVARVAIISWSLWETQFASDSAVLGQTVRFNANDFVIVGVAEREFRGIARLGRTDAWFPAGVYGALRHMELDLSKPERRSLFFMVGRLRTGASTELAQQQVRSVADDLLKTNPTAYAIVESHPPTIYRDVGSPLYGRPQTAKTFRLLFAIVAIVLLIACANVANLLLLRGIARRPEFAVRKALGASAVQLLRLHTAEGIVIGIVGGTIGVGVTLLITRIFDNNPFFAWLPGEQVHIDGRVIGFVFLLALATGFLFGLIPGIATLRDRANAALGDAGRRSTRGGGKLRASLMIVQVGGAVALIAMAFLFVRTIEALRRVDLGFDPQNVTTLYVNPAPQGYSPAKLRTLRMQLREALRSEHAIDAANLSSYGVPQRANFITDIRRADMPADKWPFDAASTPVMAGYFATLRIPLLAGRDFTEADESAAAGGPVILNATAARTMFGDRNPVGESIAERDWGGVKLHRVVGVVGDARAAHPRERPTSVLYVPMAAAFSEQISILVRSPRPVRDVEAMLRRVVNGIDPAIPVGTATPVTQIIDAGLEEERLFLRLVGLLGALAIALAAVGLYGVTAYSVAQRRREIGIRIALGARVGSVVQLVTRNAALIVALGVTIGLLTAAALARALEALLFGVERIDLVSYAGAAIVFALAALAACIAPARSAASVNPTEALRAE